MTQIACKECLSAEKPPKSHETLFLGFYMITMYDTASINHKIIYLLFLNINITILCPREVGSDPGLGILIPVLAGPTILTYLFIYSVTKPF